MAACNAAIDVSVEMAIFDIWELLKLEFCRFGCRLCLIAQPTSQTDGRSEISVAYIVAAI